MVDADGDGVLDDVDPFGGLGGGDLDHVAGRRGLDERTEIILAATFLVLIILAFIR